MRDMTGIVAVTSASILLLGSCKHGVADPPPGVPPGEAEPADEGEVTISGAVACEPVVEGRPCAIEVAIENGSDRVVVMEGIGTDRAADGDVGFLRSEYGSLFENDEGIVMHDGMAQQATPAAFLSPGAIVPPGEGATFELTTRFFDAERMIRASWYEIAAPDVPRHIYAAMATAPGDSPSPPLGMGSAFVPAESLDHAMKSASLLLWNRDELDPHSGSCTVKAEVEEAPFSLAMAREKLPGDTQVEDVSFCETWEAWVFQTTGSTWLVRETGAMGFSSIGNAVWAAIDGKDGRDVMFKVPEDPFSSKFDLEPGDGMYTQGTFVTLSGDAILDLFGFMSQHGDMVAVVTHYFFSSWYVEVIVLAP